MKLHVSGKYSGADNGFKPSYFKAVQQLLDVSLPNSGFKAEPHIKSRLKTLKSNFSIVHDMLLGTDTSGFSFKWDSETCCVDAEDKVWTDYCKTHKGAANFKGKPLPFYEKLCTIFGKDRATGSGAIDLGDDDVAQEIPMSPIEVDIESPVPAGSSKRKRSKSIEFIETFKDCSKDLTEKMEHSIGGLGEKIIASANQDIVADKLDEVITVIQKLPGLTTHERIRGMHVIGRDASKAHIFLRGSEEDKVIYIQMLEDGTLN
ncbi:hypothetical protein CTI12_AA373840 [Artemisia annua]|uniref:Myb/SANT-like domain-containing protein n=1 Tax=Artemisia annua TaxID=35608 RepID=A0A2U1MIU8_ARTAN|nr:hypothetical protein CTI12_AA373840 [Artemisia annua]